MGESRYSDAVGRDEVVPASADVVVVGGGPVGLTLALALRRQGIDVVVLEAHPGLSRHPKARGVSARSMETFRGLGIESAVRGAAAPDDHVRFYRGRTLLDPDGVVGPPPPTRRTGSTPSPGVLCSQDRLEPILLGAARGAGATVAFSRRVTAVDPTASGARVTYAVADDETPRAVDAAYVVGCDGANSTVRGAAGITLRGQRGLGRFLSVRLSAPLGPRVADRRAASYFLAPELGGFLAVDNDREWIYQHPVPPGAEAEALRADLPAIAARVRAAVGDPDLPVEVRDTMLWRMDATVAQTFRRGRIVLAGDAAHQVPPTGGHGMNLGIGDAEGLAWRLARVLRGQASSRLLDGYAAERRAVAAAVLAICVDNSRRAYEIDDELLLGTTYGAEPPVVAEPYRASGRPGRRLPHVALRGDVTSTLDLVRPGGTLLFAVPSSAWGAAVAATPALGGVVIAACTDGAHAVAVDGDFERRTGLASGEGLLVRPDGHVVARVPPVPSPRGLAEVAAAWAREVHPDAPTARTSAR